MKKLCSKVGESIAETLVAILIISLSFMILCGAVAAAARINSAANNQNTAVGKAQGSAEKKIITIEVLGLEKDAEVKLHKTENGYYYYDEPTL